MNEQTELKMLSLLVSGENRYPNTEWTENTNFSNLCENVLSGFKAAVYEKTTEDGIKTVVIAFACNNGKSVGHTCPTINIRISR